MNQNLDLKTSGRLAFIINTAYIALVAVLIFLSIRFLVPWLLPFVVGYIIAVCCKPIARLLNKYCRIAPKLAGFISLIFTYAVIVLLLILVGSWLIGAIRSLFDVGLHYYYENIIEPALHTIGATVNNIFGDILPGFDIYEALTLTLEDFRGALLALSTTALNFLGTLGMRLPAFLLAFLFTIMSSLIISMNYQQVADFFSRQIPEKHRELFSSIKTDAGQAVGSYFVAYLKIMCITFAQIAIGLSLLRVHYALLIALGVAALDLVPVLGTGSVFIPWIVVELLRGNFPMALGLGVLYGIITVVRGFIEPRIVGKELGIHPLLALCSIYAGFQMAGVAGIILAPIVAQVLVRLHRSGAITLWRT